MTIGDPNALVQRFRPLYHLHSEEMWYPCHPEDQLRCANLVSVADGSVVIPALQDAPGSSAHQFLCTSVGLQQLGQRGVHLDSSTIAQLQWMPVARASGYAFLNPSSSFVIQRDDDAFIPPFGWITSANFQPPNGTWFDHGAPNNPLVWLGGDPASYAQTALDPPAGTLRGALQEPVTAAWVQTHTVAGTAYVDLIYTAFLAWNGSISLLAGQGEHPNDVETIVVRLAASDLDNPVRIYFQQHGGFAWYDASTAERSGDRVVVYLARQSHECYPHPGRFMRLYGFADDLCDAAGVTWDAPVQYVNRPQGVDADALRCTLAAGGNPNDIVLVPLDDPGPLWQYVRFPFLGRRPASIPLTDNDFTHQPFPLSTSKWWPGEGPAAVSGPLSTKAAEASAPGVPDSYFGDVANCLGPNPLPTCSPSRPSLRLVRASTTTPRRSPVAAPANVASPAANTIVLGSAIGGATAALAPNAPFVDWRGSIGVYLLGAINVHLPDWVKLLPDPLVAGALRLTGLHALSVPPAVATSATTAKLYASALQLNATIGGEVGSFSMQINTVTINAVAQLITPVAIPASNSAQWYVPYIGPSPYSYNAASFSTTSAISNATLLSLAIAYDNITVDVGSPGLDEAIDLALLLAKTTIENDVSAALAAAVNKLLASIYDGTLRVG